MIRPRPIPPHRPAIPVSALALLAAIAAACGAPATDNEAPGRASIPAASTPAVSAGPETSPTAGAPPTTGAATPAPPKKAGESLKPAPPALKPWDQDQITILAAELATATRGFKNVLEQELQAIEKSRGGNASAMKFANVIDGLDRSTGELAQQLEAGKDRDATLQLARKIRTLVRDAKAQGPGITTTALLEEKIAPVNSLLDQIGPYYFELEAAAQKAPLEEAAQKGAAVGGAAAAGAAQR